MSINTLAKVLSTKCDQELIMLDQKGKKHYTGLLLTLFSGLGLMVLFFVLGLNGIITSSEDAFLSFFVAILMIVGSQVLVSRKKRHK